MMDAIKIEPGYRYVLFARDADPKWVTRTERSLREWFASKSPVMMINVPDGTVVYLEKVKANEGTI